MRVFVRSSSSLAKTIFVIASAKPFLPRTLVTVDKGEQSTFRVSRRAIASKWTSSVDRPACMSRHRQLARVGHTPLAVEMAGGVGSRQTSGATHSLQNDSCRRTGTRVAPPTASLQVTGRTSSRPRPDDKSAHGAGGTSKGTIVAAALPTTHFNDEIEAISPDPPVGTLRAPAVDAALVHGWRGCPREGEDSTPMGVVRGVRRGADDARLRGARRNRVRRPVEPAFATRASNDRGLKASSGGGGTDETSRASYPPRAGT